MLLGLALRAWHYLRAPSIWGDEAALVVNILNKDFGQLTGPLTLHQAAPPLFLWLEKTMCIVVGDGLDALRFVPFAASCASMVLMVYVGRRLVRAEALGWVLLLFAVSDRLLFHACEAKQYAVECLAATLLLAAYVAVRSWSLPRQLALHAALAPCLMFVSYSACFLYGGLLLALLPRVCRHGRTAMLCYGMFGLAVAGSFAVLLMGPINAQRDAEIVLSWVRAGNFADWRRPWAIPFWSARSTLELVDYYCRPVGHVLAPVAAIGLVGVWRRLGGEITGFLTLPIALAFAASLAMAYPYGGTRVMCFSLPAIGLLVAEGVPIAIAWLARRHRPAAAALALVLFTPAARTTWRACFPWSRADSAGAANYVLAHRLSGDLVTGNVCDYMYLFRHLRTSFALLDRQPIEPAADRMWVLITANTRDQRRREFRAGVPPDWETAEKHEFAKTEVYLVRRLQRGIVPLGALRVHSLPSRDDFETVR